MSSSSQGLSPSLASRSPNFSGAEQGASQVSFCHMVGFLLEEEPSRFSSIMEPIVIKQCLLASVLGTLDNTLLGGSFLEPLLVGLG